MASNITVEPSELTCTICMEFFTDPRALPCLHNFCYECLEKWSNKLPVRLGLRIQEKICCPLCKEVSSIPPGGLHNLKSNYFVSDLVGRMKKKDTNLIHGGEECSTQDCVQPSVQYCTQGCEHLCTDCFKHHSKSKGNRNHTVIDLNKVTTKGDISKVTSTYCKTHPTNYIKRYCVDCDLAVCGTCLSLNHSQRNLLDIEEQNKINRKHLKNILKEAHVMFKLIDEQIEDNEKNSQQSRTDINDIKRQISNVIDGMIDKLNSQKELLFTNLDEIEQQRDKVLIKVRDGQVFNKTAVTSLISNTDAMLHHEYTSAKQVSDLQAQFASIANVTTPSFVWSRHDSRGESQAEKMVATISLRTDVKDSEAVDDDLRESGYETMAKAVRESVDDTMAKTVDETVSQPVRESVEDTAAKAVRESVVETMAKSVSVSDNIISEIHLTEKDGVKGLVEMGDTVWIAHSGQSSIQAYPVTAPHLPQTISMHRLKNPTDMVSFPPGQSQLVISNDDKKLLWIKLCECDGVWKVAAQRYVHVRYSPRGLGVRDNQLLVCDDNVIHVLSTSGEETHRVNMQRSVRPYKAVTQLTSPGFVVMDDINKQVVLLTEKGEIQQTYRGQKGFDPGDIVCQGHSIYVTDLHNRRIDELSDDGRYVRQLISQQEVMFPRRMCVDDTGHLYVTQGKYGNKQVWVLEITATHKETQTEIPSETQTAAHNETQMIPTQAPTERPTETRDISSGDESAYGKLLTQQNVMELRITW